MTKAMQKGRNRLQKGAHPFGEPFRERLLPTHFCLELVLENVSAVQTHTIYVPGLFRSTHKPLPAAAICTAGKAVGSSCSCPCRPFFGVTRLARIVRDVAPETAELISSVAKKVTPGNRSRWTSAVSREPQFRNHIAFSRAQNCANEARNCERKIAQLPRATADRFVQL